MSVDPIKDPLLNKHCCSTVTRVQSGDRNGADRCVIGRECTLSFQGR